VALIHAKKTQQIFFLEKKALLRRPGPLVSSEFISTLKEHAGHLLAFAMAAKPVKYIFNIDNIRTERLEQLREIFDFIAPEGKIDTAAQVGTKNLSTHPV
jgi:hypothetical protein